MCKQTCSHINVGDGSHIIIKICKTARLTSTTVLHGKKLGHCNRLLKTGCNNVVGATLFQVVNDIVTLDSHVALDSHVGRIGICSRDLNIFKC